MEKQMKICENCGVEIEEGEVCPLCGSPTTDAPGVERPGDPKSSETRIRSSQEKKILLDAKIWAFEMVSLVAFTAAIVVFASDFAFGFQVTWSVYPLASIAFIWIFVSVAIALARVPVAAVLTETVLTAGFLLALGQMGGSTGWFVTLALPITGLVGIISAIVALIIKSLHPTLLQIVACLFLAAGFFLVGLELILALHFDAEAPVSWSLVAFACTLSLFFLILFIDRRLRERHSEFRKIFHF
jgi:hypothetical protein